MTFSFLRYCGIFSAISPEEAVEVAHSVEKRSKYDKETPPHVSLVKGVYVVTYWKRPGDIDTVSRRYAYRICVDAETGEYIGMEY